MEFTFDLQMFAAVTPATDGSTTSQFKWVDGTANGYFKLDVKKDKDGNITGCKGTVSEQSTVTTVAQPKKGATEYYLEVSYDATDGLQFLTVYELTTNKTTGVTSVTDVTASFTTDISSLITVNVPATTTAYKITNPANFTVAINKLTAGSTIDSLKTGDTLTTAVLAADDVVKFDDGTDVTKNYVAAEKGTMSFVGGETGNVLVSGTVQMYSDAGTGRTTMTLAGSAAAKYSASNEVTVTVDKAGAGDDSTAAVKVANGVVTSVTLLGLDIDDDADTTNKGTQVVIENVKVSGFGTNTTITYEVLNDDGTMIKRTIADASKSEETYLTMTKAGGNIYSGSYKKATFTAFNDVDFNTPSKATNDVSYIGVTAANVDIAAANVVNETNTPGLLDPTGKKFQATADGLYVKLATTRTTAGVIKITGVDLLHADASGALTKSKDSWTGTLDLDSVGVAAGKVITFTKSANAKYKVKASDVALGSSFKNLAKGDQVGTVDLADEEVGAGTYDIYATAGGNTYTTKATITSKKDDGVILSTTDGVVSALTGLDTKGEKVTFVQESATGLVSGTYEVKTNHEITRTLIDRAGLKTVSVWTSSDETSDVIAGGGFVVQSATIESNFDWTNAKNNTGYFVVDADKGVATIKAGKTTIKPDDGKKYLTVTLGTDGTVAAVGYKTYAEADIQVGGTDVATKFVGKLNITAPSKTALTLAKTPFAAVADALQLAITGAAAGSAITALEAGDTVTTGRLTKNEDTVTINTSEFTAGNTGSLGFKITATGVNLTSGTINLPTTAGSVYVNDVEISAAAPSEVTLTGGTKGYTIGGLDDGEAFTAGATEFKKIGTALYYTDGGGDVHLYAVGNGKTVASDKLDTTKSHWKDVEETLNADGTSDYGVVTVDLAAADKHMAAATVLDTANGYEYALDKYVSEDRKASAKTVLATTVVGNDEAAAANYRVNVGEVTVAAGITNKAYAAGASAVQTVKATDGWTVTANDLGTTIIGAAKGEDTLIGGGGSDSFTLQGAEDDVQIATYAGADVISGYASGKDTLTVNAATTFTLSETAADVYLATAAWDEETTTNYIQLKGMANGKAVEINGVKYHFGNGKTATTGTTFTYESGHKYVGNTSGKNTLKVNTDKEALNNVVEVDMSTAGDGTITGGAYTNIDIVDGSASSNELHFAAAATGSTLKGGTYKSFLVGGADADTLKGGSGVDTFYTADLAGSDTVEGYTVDKDYLQFEDAVATLDSTANLDAFSSKGKDVIITNANGKMTVVGGVNKAIKIASGDVTDAAYDDDVAKAAAVTYYVGQSGAGLSNDFTYEAGAKYVGNRSTSAVGPKAKALDTLKFTDTVSAVGVATAIDLSDETTYASIEAVDASGRKISTALKNGGDTTSGAVNVKASDNGTRFTGSAFDDTFTCGAGDDYIIYKAGQGADTIDGIGASTTVGDILQLNGLTDTELADVVAAINAGTDATLSFSKGGSLTFTSIETGATATLNKDNTITVKA